MGITNIGAEAAEESTTESDGQGSDEYTYDRFDLDGVSFGRQHPTTAIRGEAVALRRLYSEDDPDRPDVAVIMDDPTVVTSEEPLAGTIVVHSEEEGDQFKAVNADDDQTKILEGMGIDFAGNTFYGDIEDDFGSIDRIALKRGGGAGRRITRTLDANGATAAEAEIERNEDGEITDMTLDDDGFPAHNGGFVEYDNDGDELPRQSRDPDLRDDVVGQEIVVMIQRLSEIDPDYDGPAYWATVFANLPDERQAEVTEQYAEQSDGKSAEDFVTTLGDGDTKFVKLSPTDEFEPDEANVQENGFIKWNTFDRTDADDVLTLNQHRLDGGHGSVYIPADMSVDEVVPDEVDDLELDPDQDDWDDESDVTPAFGAGTDDATVEV